MTEDRARLDTFPARFPRLFANSNLVWGFEVGAGWTTLIENLCREIDSALQTTQDAEFEVRQVKEKFGTLRFYYRLAGVPDHVLKAVRHAVDAAERASAETCELCGAVGQLTINNHYWSTRCKRCSGS